MSESAQWNNSRRVRERVFIQGRLVLETPAHFGNGDAESFTDIALLYDPLEGDIPLLTGASIAGALRSYLREHEAGFGTPERRNGALLAERLFGHLEMPDGRRASRPPERPEEREASVQSWLMVDDALGVPPSDGPVEIRDGVAIDPKRRTAEVDERGKGKKFDMELLPAGTTFPLHFELWVPEDAPGLVAALAVALEGLESGRIGLGKRKRRGFGQCRVAGWQVRRYAMHTADGLLGWLDHSFPGEEDAQPGICALLGVRSCPSHRGEAFTLDALFRLESSLLIRSEGGTDSPVDMVHLRSRREGEWVPVLSGTSMAGILRSRALRIATTVLGARAGERLVNGMFGKRIGPGDKKPTGSRVLVRETQVTDGIADRVQNRVKIDRFTGGAYPQALFSQQPLFAKGTSPTRVRLALELRKASGHEEAAGKPTQFEAEVGLLLLVLKDLWTGDLPLGGESSVGRGRLQGEEANLCIGPTTWQLCRRPEGDLAFAGSGDPSELENRYLRAFRALREAP